MDKPTKSADITATIGAEIKRSKPSVLGKTRSKYGPGRAAKQRTSTLLNKSRRAGAYVAKTAG